MAFAPPLRELKHAMDIYFVALKEQYELKVLMGEHYSDLTLKSLRVAEKTASLDITIHEFNNFIRQNNLNDYFFQFVDAFRHLSASRY